MFFFSVGRKNPSSSNRSRNPDLQWLLQWNLDIAKCQGTEKKKWVRFNEVSRSFSIYFTITGVKKIIRYTEDFVISSFFTSRFYCSPDAVPLSYRRHMGAKATTLSSRDKHSTNCLDWNFDTRLCTTIGR